MREEARRVPAAAEPAGLFYSVLLRGLALRGSLVKGSLTHELRVAGPRRSFLRVHVFLFFTTGIPVVGALFSFVVPVLSLTGLALAGIGCATGSQPCSTVETLTETDEAHRATALGLEPASC